MAALVDHAPASAALVPDVQGWLPLHSACPHGFTDVLELLLRPAPACAGVAVHEPGHGRLFPAHVASCTGAARGLELLERASPGSGWLVDDVGLAPLYNALTFALYEEAGQPQRACCWQCARWLAACGRRGQCWAC